MNEVTEVVIALLMLVNGEMKEARIQTGYAECIKGARIAKRGLKINSNIKYSCIKCEAVLEDNIDGSKSLTWHVRWHTGHRTQIIPHSLETVPTTGMNSLTMVIILFHQSFQCFSTSWCTGSHAFHQD